MRTNLTGQGGPSNVVSVYIGCQVQALVQNVTVTLDASGNASVTAKQVDNNSTATCGFDSNGGLYVSPSNFDCTNLGANVVTLTVIDAQGNSATATATVTVTVPNLPLATWTGSVSTEWTDCQNWKYGLLPSATISALLTGGMPRYPAVAGTNTVNSLTIAPDAGLATGPCFAILVYGDWTNNGTATLPGGSVTSPSPGPLPAPSGAAASPLSPP